MASRPATAAARTTGRRPTRDSTPWEQWNPEQQAEAVEDYNKLLHHKELGEPYDEAKFAKLQKYVQKMKEGPTHPRAAARAAGERRRGRHAVAADEFRCARGSTVQTPSKRSSRCP